MSFRRVRADGPETRIWDDIPIYVYPYMSGQMPGWHDVKVQQVKSGAFRLYINLDACPEIEKLPKKFSISGTTVVAANVVAWAGDLP